MENSKILSQAIKQSQLEGKSKSKPFLRSTPTAGDDFFDGVAKDAQKVMNREIRLDELKRSCDAGVSPLTESLIESLRPLSLR